ncbi:DUF1223 domain-containing protein [Litorisediminicola beolgyonensis]|uniref:DUF1223 domain-containing protein n=1 Tax=Litorisediminicola beolgyonensis TaxID=1173614 RepID=A0ABW3ZFH2_9RHOB
MRRIAALFIACLMTSLSAASAQQDHPVVVELFTSQGCSSCPPADALLREIGQRDDVIALALHVDYWDYIGWRDTFAQPGFTRRQKGYARRSGQQSIYTPQVVVDGAEDAIGHREKDISALIARHKAAPAVIALDLSRHGAELQIAARALRKIGPVDIVLVRYQPKAEVAVTRGENAGHKLGYSHIVTEIRPVAQWNGEGAFETRVTAPGQEPVVILAQEPDYGPVLAAARLR